MTKSTGADGLVQVTVQSGTIPTPVWVIASTTDSGGKAITTQSVKLSISTGRPAQDRMSLAVESHNIEGLDYDGQAVKVTARLSDRLGNPVPDGTAVNFIASGAQIGATCQTEVGACSVDFVSGNPRLNGRIAILAYALGEESFLDLNSDNLYALAVEGPNFTDLGNAFLDRCQQRIDAALRRLCRLAADLLVGQTAQSLHGIGGHVCGVRLEVLHRLHDLARHGLDALG